MKISVTCGSIIDIQCDLLVVNEFEKVKHPGGATGAADKALDGMITELSAVEEITGKIGNIPVIHTKGKIAPKRVAVAGLGDRKDFDLEKVRTVAAIVVKKAKELNAKKVATIVHGAGSGLLDPRDSAEAVVMGSLLANYKFAGFKTGERSDHEIDELVIVDYDPEKIKAIEAGARRGEIVAGAVNRARDLVNGPSNKITPTFVAEYAKALASENGMTCEVIDLDGMKKIGMHSIVAVAKGSKEPPKLVILKYEPKGAGGDKIGLVGKGITFDAGGISIKPAKGMDEMKTDMSGAAAVIETMGILQKLKIERSVIAVVPLTENMPSGAALKPGDIVGSLEGKNIEVISTDAEGRMILSDALTYARRLGAAKLIDIATLTGGCMRALGDLAAGIFGNDQSLIDEIVKAGNSSGERYWQLPLYQEYKEYVKSDVADMKNCSEDGKASPSVGAIYLKEFVGGVPWVHLDIAGTAYLSREIGPLGKGATGVGVRTLVDYLKG
jgi:leucyl aminopeptidase